MKLKSILRNRATTIAVIIFILCAGVVGALVGKAKAKMVYESSAVVMVIPPGAGNSDATMNPFVNLDSRIVQLALALTTSMNSAANAAAMGPIDPAVTNLSVDTVKTSMASADAGNTAQIQLVAQATDPTVARQYADGLTSAAGTRLHDMQAAAGVRGATFASLVVVSPPSDAQPISSSQTRSILSAAVIAMAVAAVLAFLALLGCDRLQALRSSRRTTDSTSEPDLLSGSSGSAPFVSVHSASDGAPHPTAREYFEHDSVARASAAALTSTENGVKGEDTPAGPSAGDIRLPIREDEGPDGQSAHPEGAADGISTVDLSNVDGDTEQFCSHNDSRRDPVTSTRHRRAGLVTPGEFVHRSS